LSVVIPAGLAAEHCSTSHGALIACVVILSICLTASIAVIIYLNVRNRKQQQQFKSKLQEFPDKQVTNLTVVERKLSRNGEVPGVGLQLYENVPQQNNEQLTRQTENEYIEAIYEKV